VRSGHVVGTHISDNLNNLFRVADLAVSQ
jgi:hypothetical protein